MDLNGKMKEQVDNLDLPPVLLADSLFVSLNLLHVLDGHPCSVALLLHRFVWEPRKVPACLCLGRSLALVAFCVQHLLVCPMEAHSVTVAQSCTVTHCGASMTQYDRQGRLLWSFGFWTVG